MKATTKRPRARRSEPKTTRAVPSANFLDQFTDAVLILDRDRKIVFVNPAAEELTGQPESRVLGENYQEVLPQLAPLGAMIDRVEQHGQSESHSEEQLMRRGRSILVRLTCLPLWDKSDRIGGTAIVIHDLSYQKTLEDPARRNESLARLGTLVAGLAHEVKNPLAGIKGAAQLLEGRLANDSGLHEYTQVISREVDRLAELVQDLLTLGAPPKPQLRVLNVHRVIRHVSKVMRGELTDARIRLRYEFDPSLPDVHADEGQLSQVFINLLKNAIDAMAESKIAGAEDRAIRIATRMETDFHILREHNRSGQFLRIEVADQGVGIDPVEAQRLFEPCGSTKPRGTGLGLAISQRIIADHGGTIRAYPNRPNGTVVSVTLPTASR